MSQDATHAEDILSPRPDGPWDSVEAPPEASVLDLGSLRVPLVEGIEIRVEAEQETSAVTGVTLAVDGAALQISAYAAPRTTGIWGEVRGQLRASLTSQGATIDDVDGEFGPEFTARVGGQRMRFLGVNGPRWFLRAVIHGDAVDDGPAAQRMRALLRGVVVHRGEGPMAPGDALPLQLPETETVTEPEPT
jgi:hypothetical protein